MRRLLKAMPWWGGILLGGVIATAAVELPQVNWRLVVAPIDVEPLTIRQDAKGDGRFFAPRSGNRRHRGIDLVAALGNPVRAIRSGTVAEVGLHRGLGHFIELEHRGGLHSRYAHLEEVAVRVGQRVRQGQVIGTVGKTGNAKHEWITPHLHLEVLSNGQPINPQVLGLQVMDPGGSMTLSPHAPGQRFPSEVRDASGGG
jgi:murein DD-endopeptidase MepM/ murein hydrolase activator NlpD